MRLGRCHRSERPGTGHSRQWTARQGRQGGSDYELPYLHEAATDNTKSTTWTEAVYRNTLTHLLQSNQVVIIMKQVNIHEVQDTTVETIEHQWRASREGFACTVPAK